MNYNDINKVLIKTIALALGELNNKVVYVGGSVVCLYADDAAAEETRPTKDVDVFLEIATYGKLVKLQEQLATMGFYPEHEGGVMCRFKYKDILVNIMATKEVGWASADKWFEPGLKTLQPYKIDEVTINILHISYFLAAKFNTFHDRGEDARTSGIGLQIPFDQLTLSDWQETLNVNLTSAFIVTKAAVPAMIEKGFGRIINISSVAAQTGGAIGPHYAASKAGMIGVTHSYANLLAKYGITVNAIAPALIETDMIRNLPNVKPGLAPIQRFGLPEEIADVVLLLATNGFITGQTFNVNGGMYMS